LKIRGGTLLLFIHTLKNAHTHALQLALTKKEQEISKFEGKKNTQHDQFNYQLDKGTKFSILIYSTIVTNMIYVLLPSPAAISDRA
jgi:hypothetical protein